MSVIEVIAAENNRVGIPGQIYVAIQCGCDWSVVVTDPEGDASHYDLWDVAESRLKDHVEAQALLEGDERSKLCQPWLWR